MPDVYLQEIDKKVLTYETWDKHAKQYEINLANKLKQDNNVVAAAERALTKMNDALVQYKTGEKSDKTTSIDKMRELESLVGTLEVETGKTPESVPAGKKSDKKKLEEKKSDEKTSEEKKQEEKKPEEKKPEGKKEKTKKVSKKPTEPLDKTTPEKSEENQSLPETPNKKSAAELEKELAELENQENEQEENQKDPVTETLAKSVIDDIPQEEIDQEMDAIREEMKTEKNGQGDKEPEVENKQEELKINNEEEPTEKSLVSSVSLEKSNDVPEKARTNAAFDIYTLLKLSEDASLAELNSAYKKELLKYHPDKNPGNEEAAEKFKEIANAYQIFNNARSNGSQKELGGDGPQKELGSDSPQKAIASGKISEVPLLKDVSHDQERKDITAKENSEKRDRIFNIRMKILHKAATGEGGSKKGVSLKTMGEKVSQEQAEEIGLNMRQIKKSRSVFGADILGSKNIEMSNKKWYKKPGALMGEESAKSQKKKGHRMVAGSSDAVAKMLTAYKWVGALPIDLLLFRAAIAGWVMSEGQHSLNEVVTGAEKAGVIGDENKENAITLYRTLSPFSARKLRAEVAQEQTFPNEHVYRDMLNDDNLDPKIKDKVLRKSSHTKMVDKEKLKGVTVYGVDMMSGFRSRYSKAGTVFTVDDFSKANEDRGEAMGEYNSKDKGKKMSKPILTQIKLRGHGGVQASNKRVLFMPGTRFRVAKPYDMGSEGERFVDLIEIGNDSNEYKEPKDSKAVSVNSAQTTEEKGSEQEVAPVEGAAKTDKEAKKDVPQTQSQVQVKSLKEKFENLGEFPPGGDDMKKLFDDDKAVFINALMYTLKTDYNILNEGNYSEWLLYDDITLKNKIAPLFNLKYFQTLITGYFIGKKAIS
ncbi:MAG: DnaJ domain-containing protein [Oscillospiraceae bacterium]|nr:DnaJ domain-containing protein [Oscillospiraceae bacterium]